ncbi:hypothetical protein DAEQUDRAFT_690288 [Daedalea quercina L-15889]|uniref:BTB domain-containing protein n=1 Tax=Daedalea quercina L-15889 TaxID=1314783 RepID=A0A165QSC0_9APHY|nr:hypothetical protein DAEQUDRAFT_690288 [Daedalea quercina L-15889]
MYAATFWSRAFPRSLFAIISISTTNMTNSNPSMSVEEGAARLRRHPKYWLDDGSLVVRTQDDLFKVHRTLLQRHSQVISSLAERVSQDESSLMDGCPTLHVPQELGVESTDFEMLLEHLYHDFPLGLDAPLSRVAAILRVSSKRQLDFPLLHRLARRELEHMVPSDPTAFYEVKHPDSMLILAVDYDVHTIQKALFYTVATHANLQHDEPESAIPGFNAPQVVESVDPDLANQFKLSPELTKRCQRLLDDLVGHFTPVLFTVATAGHMTCTDIFAEQWMPLVIQPALENSGLCRPLETLQTIIDLDWEAQGLCGECVRAKREEWREEQRAVWERLDGWLGLTSEK